MKRLISILHFFLLLSVCRAAIPMLKVEFPVVTNNDTKAPVILVWSNFSPRAEIAPRFSIQNRAGKSGKTALRIDTTSGEQFGGWRCRIEGIIPEQKYKFSAWYRAKGIQNERRSIIARLEWLDKNGKLLRPPEFCLDVENSGRWKKVAYIATAPEKSAMVDIQLALGFDKGSVWWDEISFLPETNAKERILRVATVYHRPQNTRSSIKSVEEFCQLVETNNYGKLDFVCLPEGITVIGTGKSYADVSEPIPGPTTERLGKLASKINAYVVAGIYERKNNVIYNSAVLIDRNGKLIGVYRKTHLPREEWESGLTPGNEYPVFDTEFGKVGIIICWDLQFPEPARAMAAKGAELIFLPIWGGNEILAKARAIENSVFLVTATYDMRSFILDPTGSIIAEATATNPFVVAEISLDKIYYQYWIGNMKTRTWKEWRPDLRW